MGGQDYSSGGFEAEGEFPLVKGVFGEAWRHQGFQEGSFPSGFHPPNGSSPPWSLSPPHQRSNSPSFTTLPWQGKPNASINNDNGCNIIASLTSDHQSSYFKFVKIPNMNLLHMKILFSITE